MIAGSENQRFAGREESVFVDPHRDRFAVDREKVVTTTRRPRHECFSPSRDEAAGHGERIGVSHVEFTSNRGLGVATSLVEGVGAFGSPVKVGEASGA